MVSVLVKLWLLQILNFHFQPHLLKFPPFVWPADPDHVQMQGLSAPVGASSEPPQKSEAPLKHKHTSQQLQLQDGTEEKISKSKYVKGYLLPLI